MEHPELVLPAESRSVWRYMSFAKYVSLLSASAIHFSRADRFPDTFESAAIPAMDLLTAQSYYRQQIQNPVVNMGGVSIFDKQVIAEYVKDILQLPGERAVHLKDEDLPKYMMQIASRFVYVNCWQLNESESAGMWDLYLDNAEGVAIRSTIGALKKSVENKKYPVYTGQVNYLDYSKHSWGEFHPLKPVFYKRIHFSHETEIRAVIINPPDMDVRKTAGINIPVDLKQLIHQVHVSPKAGHWFLEVINSVNNKYGLGIAPVQSGLYDAPAFE